MNEQLKEGETRVLVHPTMGKVQLTRLATNETKMLPIADVNGGIKTGVVVGTGATQGVGGYTLSVNFNTATADSAKIYIFDIMQAVANATGTAPAAYADGFYTPTLQGGATLTDTSFLGWNADFFCFGKMPRMVLESFSIINTSSTNPNTTLQSATTFKMSKLTAENLTSGSFPTEINIFQKSNYSNTNYGNGRYDANNLSMFINGYSAIAFQVKKGESLRLEFTLVAVATNGIVSNI